ncbi:MAG: decarboxylating NADP(+)-dependent phosphogluconate dehydrogenase [Gammaproteobacteria bacterium]|nr:decarboxylating NADP(+)-dependent phosphogluconate dehydrogenase [Gammaproteobacteria bacterium]
MSSDIGLVGLGVMGRNIALNIADHGYRVAVYNRSTAAVDQLVSSAESHQQLTGCHDYAALCDELARPRIVMMMVQAGEVVDKVIDGLLPHLQQGDIIIDGGNSYYKDSQRRYDSLKGRGIRFLGMGVSGGGEGARHGPSLMPGGDPEAWPMVKDIFQSIAARADDGEPCCRWVGNGGAGHYVKMVHNGIEYGDMQLIAEAWQLMYDGLGVDMPQLADTFSAWNAGVLSSYLVEITADILRVPDSNNDWRVNNILDVAGQKGTGRWTAIDSLDLGVPLTLITEAVYARALSSRKEERLQAAKTLGGAHGEYNGDIPDAVAAIHDGLYAAKIISYAQGFMQLRQASEEYGWQLEFGDIALLWRAGCIIRSRFLNDIKAAYDKQPELLNLLLDEFFSQAMRQADRGWRETVKLGIELGIPVPAMSSALGFYDGYRSAVLPANLLQAQRDYFGAHTYKRIDRPDKVFHTRWTEGGNEETFND